MQVIHNTAQMLQSLRHIQTRCRFCSEQHLFFCITQLSTTHHTVKRSSQCERAVTLTPSSGSSSRPCLPRLVLSMVSISSRLIIPSPFKSQMSKQYVMCSSSEPLQSFFLKMDHPQLFFHLVSSFQTNILTTSKREKMSIQKTVMGFELTTFGTRVSSNNHQTRAPDLYKQSWSFTNKAGPVILVSKI